MKSIAIIPARSGSKGLKDKNIKLLNGVPMLAYTIKAALESGKYDRVHVSTDSEQYAQIAREHGAHQLFLRTPELSGDTAGSWEVVRWTLEQYGGLGESFDLVSLLQPTSPLRNAADIVNAFALLTEKDADAVVSVCQTEHSPLWCNVLPEDSCMKGFLDRAKNDRRQALPDYYRINGAIYLVKATLLQQPKLELYGEKTFAYVMPKERSVDIDDEIDFTVAEAIAGRLTGWHRPLTD